MICGTWKEKYEDMARSFANFLVLFTFSGCLVHVPTMDSQIEGLAAHHASELPCRKARIAGFGQEILTAFPSTVPSNHVA